jgi:hypothetical protein
MAWSPGECRASFTTRASLNILKTWARLAAALLDL